MDGRTVSDTDRVGLQILFEHISSAAFHDSHQRLNDTNRTVVKEWVQKWTPRLRSSDHSSISAFQAQPNNPEQIIVDVFTWLFDLSSPSPIMWIHHQERSQTLFLAHTIARILARLGKLSGSFFSSKQDDPIDITRIIPALAFQLARNVSNTRSVIAQTVLQDLSIFDLEAESQIERLIVDPLSFALDSGNMEARGLPSVFLIHGLDEFDNADQSQMSFLDAFSDALTLLATKNIPYRLLLVGCHSSCIERCISNPSTGQKVLDHPIAMPVSLEVEEEDGRMKRKAWMRDDVPWHLMNTLNGHEDWVLAIAFSPDGTRLASGSDDMTVRLWDGKSGSLIAILHDHTDYVRSLAFSVDGTRLVSVSDDSMVRLWEGKTGSLIANLHGHTDTVLSLAFSPDGSRFASGSADETVRLWEFGTRSLVATLDGHGSSIYDIAFSADGSILASGSDDKTVRLWDGKTGNLIATLNGHSGLVRTLAFSSYGSRLASGSYDKTIRLWEGKTGTLVATLEGHTAEVYNVAFSPDGSLLASGSEDGTVRLWDVKMGSPISTLHGHSSVVYSVAFSADGSMLTSGSGDKTVRLWDVEKRSHITTLEGHSSIVRSVVFSPDGLRLASASDDCTVRLWH